MDYTITLIVVGTTAVGVGIGGTYLYKKDKDINDDIIVQEANGNGANGNGANGNGTSGNGANGNGTNGNGTGTNGNGTGTNRNGANGNGTGTNGNGTNGNGTNGTGTNSTGTNGNGANAGKNGTDDQEIKAQQELIKEKLNKLLGVLEHGSKIGKSVKVTDICTKAISDFSKEIMGLKIVVPKLSDETRKVIKKIQLLALDILSTGKNADGEDILPPQLNKEFQNAIAMFS